MSNTKIWREYTAAGVNAQYNLAGHPDRDSSYSRYAEQSRAARALLLHSEIAYGDHPRERFEFFPGARHVRNGPVFVFIHGGYWRALEKETWSYIAPAFVARDIAFANIEYPLAPEKTVGEIVSSVRKAIVAVHRVAAAAGVDVSRVVISGHSAGGHLTAMMLRTDWSQHGLANWRPAAGVPISGLFELEPLRHYELNDTLKLTLEAARALSPALLPMSGLPPVLAVVGGAETDEFRRQTIDYAARLTTAGVAARTHLVPAANHFTVMAALGDPTSALFPDVLQLITRR
ncbi:MAG: alpha/beta hydrolase [Burkholderiales bacterium]